MNMFPWLFDKRPSSNFYKSQDVTNRRLQEIYNDLFIVYENFHLDKRLLVWKEQAEPYIYTMRFVANFPYIKSVTIAQINQERVAQNDTIIYTNTYTYDENKSYFDYSITLDTRNSVSDGEVEIIPSDGFIFTVETHEEIIITKGFPENDTIEGDIYDHDKSLDRLGKLNNIPRKTYIPTDDYYNTEPPFNDRLSEDDYHYMKRMIEYNIRLHTDHAPVLELWKLYGIETAMINRETLIAKMFDILKHPYSRNDDGLKVEDWSPQKWEHKDKFCDESELLGRYFFASADTVQPVKKQSVTFTFNFVNSLIQTLNPEGHDYVVDIYRNGDLLYEGYDKKQWVCPGTPEFLDEYEENIFLFVGRDGEVEIGETEIGITVRGCSTADIFVKADSTASKEDGSWDYPYKTLEKGIQAVNAAKNLVAVFGDVNTKGKIPVRDSCTIIGCNNARIINTDNAIFFNVDQDKTLTVLDMTFVTDHFTGTAEQMIWSNENLMRLVETALVYNLNYGVLIDDIIPEKFVKNLEFNAQTGILSWLQYDKSEFTKLSDFKDIVANLDWNNDFGFEFTESEIYEIEQKFLNGQFVFFEDRTDLVRAIFNLSFNSTNGILSFSELTADEIVYDAKVHDIVGA
jgi:hypothetical protein